MDPEMLQQRQEERHGGHRPSRSRSSYDSANSINGALGARAMVGSPGTITKYSASSPMSPGQASHRSCRHHKHDLSAANSRPRPPLTPNIASRMSQAAPSYPLLPSAPASPPTPAPSPTPNQQQSPSEWHISAVEEPKDTVLDEAHQIFNTLDTIAKQRFLRSLVDICDSQALSFLHHLVSPRLKKDPFKALPNELCFRVLEFIDDPTTFVRASQVSRRWREIVGDDQAWKTLCEKHAYRRMSSDSIGSSFNPTSISFHAHSISASQIAQTSNRTSSPPRQQDNLHSFIENADRMAGYRVMALEDRKARRGRIRSSHRSRFKHAYMVESAWRKSGLMTARHITPDHGVVTSLHLTKKYVIVALDNAKIHIFNTRGDHQRTLAGHVMGVWAMVPWNDILVSGGCDRDVRVWNMASGASLLVLHGHTSTVRCLKMVDGLTAISGSRDTTLRVWNLANGTCSNVLMGHQASVRCLEIHGDLVVSGSYDTTAKIWRISTGECLRTLQGHFSQIYAIAFDGHRIATGSLDTSVRIWNPNDGTCMAILQGHTSLVGQLQMRGTNLVTGGSDGTVRVWSLQTFMPIHRLAAHDNSVTSLQFDDARIVSGGSDGRVKIWDLEKGTLVRELSQPAEAVWRVAFESEICVVMASRAGRTVMEVWNFAPPENSTHQHQNLPQHQQQSEYSANVSQDEALNEEMIDLDMLDVDSGVDSEPISMAGRHAASIDDSSHARHYSDSEAEAEAEDMTE